MSKQKIAYTLLRLRLPDLIGMVCLWLPSWCRLILQFCVDDTCGERPSCVRNLLCFLTSPLAGPPLLGGQKNFCTGVRTALGCPGSRHNLPPELLVLYSDIKVHSAAPFPDL
jgi:hypothetical protein